MFWLATLVLGVAWAFGFSWLQGCERLGAWVEGLLQERQARCERVEDQRLGEQAPLGVVECDTRFVTRRFNSEDQHGSRRILRCDGGGHSQVGILFRRTLFDGR